MKRFQEVRAEKETGSPSLALYGGEPAAAISAYAAHGGVCRESKLSTQTSEFKSSANKYLEWKIDKLLNGEDPTGGPDQMDPREVQADLEDGSQSHSRKKKPKPSILVQQQLKPQKPSPNALLNCQNRPNAASNIADLQASTNALALSKLAGKINEICSPRLPLKPMAVETDDVYTSGFNPSQRIKEALKNHMPIGIGYDDSFLKQGPDAPKKHHYNHASSIVGSRIKNGQCEFLLRNSWGLDCEGTDYSDKIFNSKACKNGNVWIPEADFADRIQQTTTVKLK